MANEGGEWIMKGLDWDNPHRIRSWRELINWINEVGFLPLFANEVRAFRRRNMSLPSGGPAIPNRIPGSGERLFPRPVKWHTGSSSTTRLDSFPGSGSPTLQIPAWADMTLTRRGMTNWSSAAIRQSWMPLRTAACIPALN